ncbi:putative dynein beta chain, ciliary-like [Penaeus vannamei]|uniref:Putative dynein beta chain, ciliary-like n=1 Tax=Penaeus vannamei TaxID=6689 RepID=A0A423T1V6_PENVA|nr:putative dynein beta chain, ciliary-like [Penaeus vannamei]
MVKEDVSRQLYSLRGTVYRMWGQLRGQTLLPLPFGMDALEKAERHALETGEMTDSQLKSAIEGVVIKWVHQVDEVLNQDTDDLAGPDHFPTPLEEITFWSKRRENFSHIARQLKDKKVMMMSNILEVTESAYYPAFVKMCADVNMAVHEARDIMIHLTPLKPMLEEMESMEFQEAPPLIPPLVHCICLLWAHCPDYRKPDRIVTLFREITNLLIGMGRTFIGTIGFQAETTEPLQKINTCVNVFKTFRDSFEEHRGRVDTYFPEDERPRRWEFHPTHAFARMDQFLSRLANIKEIFDIAKEFLKIEKVEFGGPKGKVLGASVSAVYSEFNEAYTAFSIRTYDCLDPAEADFDESHRQFKKKVTELEQRLSLIVNHALQESQSPEAYFKVVELLGSILERPIIQAEYTTCLPHLLQLLKQEIETARELFENWQHSCGIIVVDFDEDEEDDDEGSEDKDEQAEEEAAEDGGEDKATHRYFPPVSQTQHQTPEDLRIPETREDCDSSDSEEPTDSWSTRMKGRPHERVQGGGRSQGRALPSYNILTSSLPTEDSRFL